MPCVLLLDVGNSAIKAAWSDGDVILETRRWELTSSAGVARASDDIRSSRPFDTVVYMSVNPPASEALIGSFDAPTASVHEIGKDLPRGMPVKTEEPERVGTDRTTTAIAAYRIHEGALIVVDFGTAITFDCVDADGAFLGGAICPGVRMITSALERDAAFLPLVDIAPREHFLGRSTEEAMICGVYHCLVETTNGILEGLFREMGGMVPVIATGGDAELVAPSCPAISEVRPGLSLEGLLVLYRRHRETLGGGAE
jgi:type III pantothenate kinase